MSAEDDDSLGAAKERFLVLHKGLGLHRPDLYAHLGPALRGLWGISARDSTEIVRAKALAQIESAIVTRVAPEIAEVARDYYNASAEPAMWSLNFEDRLKAIHVRMGSRYSVSNIRRNAKTFVPQILAALKDVASVRSPLPPPMHVDHAKPLIDTIRDLQDPDRLAKRVINVFLRTVVHWPGQHGTDCQVAHTTDFGAWLCVFTTINHYRNYRYESSAPWPEQPTQALGICLLLDLHAHRPGVGLIVNPGTHRHADPIDTLCLPAGLIGRIAAHHNGS